MGNFRRTSGGKDLPLVECVNPRLSRYRIRWDIQEETSSETDINEKSNTVSFVEYELNHKPTIDEIKDIIISWYNKEIEEEIASGFEWNGMRIWLSTENQFNYKAAYDMAVQTKGLNLPITFKFGDSSNPVYFEFTTVDTLADFYVSAMSFINSTLKNGWEIKDSIDFNVYEQYL